jgi:hypothetical protein
MSLICMNKGVGTKIEESLGILEDVDVARDSSGWGKYLRLKVNIALHNPLERGKHYHWGERSTGLCSNMRDFQYSVSIVAEFCIVQKDAR